jgi:plastocyanin
MGPAVVVDMTGELLVFEPALLEIRAGQTVVWKNSSAREVHTVTADPRQAANAQNVELPKGAQPFDSGYMNPGQAYQYTFKKPGTYRYVCTLHEVQRMVGKIIVKP